MRHLLFVIFFAAVSFGLSAQDQTLRVDYMFSGTDKSVEISLDELSRYDGWAGRRTNLTEVPVRGNGQICMTDVQTGDTLYRMSFSTLFQEWQTTEEATKVRRSFENVFLLPMPTTKAKINVHLYDFFGNIVASLNHIVDPSDILIRQLKPIAPEHRYLLKSGTPQEKIDVAIVAEGYTAEEMDMFYADAQTAMEAILKHEPFGQYKDRFNFVAVALESQDSGVSVPQDNVWSNTALGSHFMTFYSPRYLTTNSVHAIHDALAGIDYEHLIILANTDTYGGGGIYNSYTLTTAHNPMFKPVVVHEFGHSFGALADEYFYEHADHTDGNYKLGYEPWEQNITTMVDFESKWKDMVAEGVEIPSQPTKERQDNYTIGVYEGGGYMTKGMYRPAVICRMRDNVATQFCKVCQRAIERIILYNTEQE